MRPERQIEEVRGSRGRPRNPAIDEAILAAALDHLVTVGYTAFSMTAVADAAGVTKPALYRRWSGKEDLATAALLRLQSDEPHDATGDTERDLVQVLSGFHKNLLRPHGMALIGVLLADEASAPALIALFRERITKRRRRLIRSILDDAKNRGEFHDSADLDAAVNMLVGSFYAKYLADGKVPRGWPSRVVKTVLRSLRGERS